MKAQLKEVEDRLKKIKKSTYPPKWKSADYVGGGMSKLDYLDLKSPVVKAAYDEGFSFSKETSESQWKVWNYIWKNSNIFEAMNMALRWASSRSLEERHSNRTTLLSWLGKTDNWAHSDSLSDFYSELLEHYESFYFKHFKKWNRSKNPWERRQSMVGLFFYSRQRKKYVSFKTAISFVDKHLDDDHYYVQKGVGWTLREIYNVYPKDTYRYLMANAAKIKPAAWTAATEKLSAADKKKLMTLRKRK